MIRKAMFKQNIIILILILLFSHLSWADHYQTFDIKELKESGKINSLENILDKLSGYGINRLLEVELKRGVFQENSLNGKKTLVFLRNTYII